MIPTRIAFGTMLVVTVLAGCKQKDEATATPAPVTEASTTPASEGAKGFDIESVPMSTASLGQFPYVALPAGYTSKSHGKTDKDFARFPFWVNGQVRWVEGKFHGEGFATEPGKDFSALEVSRNFDGVIQQMGGVKVSEGRIPVSVIETWGDEITQGFVDGLGDVYNNPATTYLVRRADGNIWLHLVTTRAGGAFVVGKEAGFQQTAQLLPAAELKRQIDSTGKVALQVNFATDKTEILPESMPQIDQVVELLKADPALRLSINGHTDNTGDKAHNQKLSEGRAKAVLAVVEARGIDAARLKAQGFGDTQPVADNSTETGKAQNRRVELVKS